MIGENRLLRDNALLLDDLDRKGKMVLRLASENAQLGAEIRQARIEAVVLQGTIDELRRQLRDARRAPPSIRRRVLSRASRLLRAAGRAIRDVSYGF